MERLPQPPETHVHDCALALRDDDYIETYGRLHDQVNPYVYVEDEIERNDTDAIAEINDLLQLGEFDEISCLIAKGYRADSFGAPAKEPELLSYLAASYVDTVVIKLGDQRHIALLLAVPSEDGDEENFYVLPKASDVASLEQIITEETEADIQDATTILHDIAQDDAQLLRGDMFFGLATDAQHQMLDNMTAHINQQLEYYYTSRQTEFSIDTTYYFEIHDNADPNEAFDLSRRNQSSVPSHERFTPTGTNLEAIFPERVLDKDKDFHSLKDFFIGKGCPYYSLRNDTLGCTYWIPIPSVEEISFVPLIDEDD